MDLAARSWDWEQVLVVFEWWGSRPSENPPRHQQALERLSWARASDWADHWRAGQAGDLAPRDSLDAAERLGQLGMSRAYAALKACGGQARTSGARALMAGEVAMVRVMTLCLPDASGGFDSAARAARLLSAQVPAARGWAPEDGREPDWLAQRRELLALGQARQIEAALAQASTSQERGRL